MSKMIFRRKRQQALATIQRLLLETQLLAHDNDFEFLSYLLAMAIREAERCDQEYSAI